MKTRVRRSISAVSFFAVSAMVAAAVSSIFACSSSAKLVGNGGQCQLASDCEEGLVCLPNGQGTERVCSNNLAAVQKTEVPPDSGPKDASFYDAPDDEDSSTPDTTTGDSGHVDSGPVVVVDSAAPQDAAKD